MEKETEANQNASQGPATQPHLQPPQFGAPMQTQPHLQPPQFEAPMQTQPHLQPPQFGAPMQMSILRPSLPFALWPHNFIIFSVMMAIGLGLLNFLTLPVTVPAVVLGVAGYYQSKEGNYEGAKSSSKVTIILLIVAVLIFGACWIAGLLPSVYVLTIPHYLD